MCADLYNPHLLFSMESTRHDSDYIMPNSHYHNAYELYFLEQGYHNILIHDAIFDMAPYDVALYKPNIFHKSLRSQGCTRTCIYFTDRFLRLHFTEFSIRTLLNCFEKDVISLNHELFLKVKKLLLLLEKEDINAPNNHVFIYVTDILSLLNDNKNSERPEQIRSAYTSFTPILSYIHQNYNKISTIEEIADQFYISKFRLCHLFKEATGLTLIQYITKIKIQNACNMLVNTDLSILDIGTACGFNSSMYFCKIFKQSLSLTPSEFRKKAKI
jgi:AraC-like DNA-binding protein